MIRTCFALGMVLMLCNPAASAGGKRDQEEKDTLKYRALLLNSKKYKLRIAALSKLEIPGPRTPGVLEDVVKILLRHKDEQLPDAELAEVRVAAAQWIGGFGKDAKKALPALKMALSKDPSDEVKEAAARALGTMGADTEEALQELAVSLLSKHHGLRAAAAETLKDLKDKAEPALRQTLQALKEFKDAKTEDPLDRIFMVQIAAQLPERAADSVPVLAEVVSDAGDHSKVRKAAAEALGRLGTVARTAGPSLEKTFTDKAAGLPLRRAALVAFDAVGVVDKTSWPALKGLFQETDAALRLKAVRVAGPVGKEVPAVIADLATLSLKDPDVEVRLAAIQELGRLGPTARAAIPTLQTVSSDSRPPLRMAAKMALKQIQPNP